MKLTLDQAAQKYGPIVNGHWAREAEFCSMISVPADIGRNWVNKVTGHPVERIYCNKDMQAPLLQAFKNVRDLSLIEYLQTFDGCFYIRMVRGARSKTSWHSYALALDIDAASNALGTQGTIHPDLVACFKEAGFIWGGDFHTRKDPMHFQYGIG